RRHRRRADAHERDARDARNDGRFDGGNVRSAKGALLFAHVARARGAQAQAHARRLAHFFFGGVSLIALAAFSAHWNGVPSGAWIMQPFLHAVSRTNLPIWHMSLSFKSSEQAGWPSF